MTIQDLDPTAAHAAMSADKHHVFLDVRTVEEYDRGHPEGAVNVPWALLDPRTGQMARNEGFLEAAKKVARPEQTVYASCQSGIRSMNACKELEAAGYSKLVNVSGGFGGKRGPMGNVVAAGWHDAGLPVETTRSTYGQG
ncbi:MAG: rhodanese-like domain-containing protein [Planctomycetota bacterium]|jgi:rhodanese-related sulfurtransferase